MVIRRTVIAAVLIAVPLSFVAPAQATCSDGYFGQGEKERDKSICGVPNIDTSIQHVTDNLEKNFSPGDAARNLEHNLTHGVGQDDSAE